MISWVFFFRVKTEEKALLLLRRVEKRAGIAFDIKKMEKYWKDETLFRSYVSWCPAETDPVKMAWEILQVCNNLAYTWHITGPVLTDDVLVFHGATTENDKIKIPGLVTAFFDAGTGN